VAARSAMRGALVAAQGEAELAASAARDAEQTWAAARGRTRALEQLEQRRAVEEARRALKVDQRRIDDLRRAPRPGDDDEPLGAHQEADDR